MIIRLRQRLYNLLRWSEKYAKTDMVYLFRGSTWLTGGHFVSTGVVFLSSIAFANLLPIETYGTYKYVISVFGILSITTLSGMGGVLTQAIPRGAEGSVFPVVKKKLQWGMLGMIGALGVSFYYYIFGNQVLSVAFLIAAGFVPLMDTFAIYQSYLQGKKQFGIYSLYATIIQIIAVGLTVATLFLTDNILHILAVYFLSWTILRVIAFRLSIKYFPPNTTHDPKVITYGKHTSLIDAIATIIGSLDQILIFHFLGASGVAIYAFALAPATQLGGLFKNIPTLAIPKFAERPISSIRAQLKSRMLLLFLIGILSAAAYAFFAPFLYQWFFPQYIDSVRYSQALGFLLALSLPQTIFGAVISSKLTQTSEKLLYLWNIPGAVSLIVVLCTIQQLGIFSVVLGKFVHMSLVLAMNTIIWKNLIKNND